MERAIEKRITNKKSQAMDDRGMSTVEYIIVLVVVALGCILAWQKFGAVVSEKIAEQATAVEGISAEAQ